MNDNWYSKFRQVLVNINNINYEEIYKVAEVSKSDDQLKYNVMIALLDYYTKSVLEYIKTHEYDNYEKLRNIIYYFDDIYCEHITCSDISSLFYNIVMDQFHDYLKIELYVMYDVLTYFTFKAIDNILINILIIKIF